MESRPSGDRFPPVAETEAAVGGVKIRCATRGDAADLARLAGQLGYETSEDAVARALAAITTRDDHALFVGGDAERVDGWIHAFVVVRVGGAPFTEISGLVVDESRWGTGVGTALLEAVEAWSTNRGVTSIRARAGERRRGAHAFYELRAYERIKTQFVFHRTTVEEAGS